MFQCFCADLSLLTSVPIQSQQILTFTGSAAGYFQPPCFMLRNSFMAIMVWRYLNYSQFGIIGNTWNELDYRKSFCFLFLHFEITLAVNWHFLIQLKPLLLKQTSVSDFLSELINS